ncbi:MAG: hypothetical protein A3D94_12820 [Alphaproteobacteria bacterium RIFCSPHIGHO2_12_FULL_66_14]|jgi:hypothetical protein|nr:MAG: hypothetical protein A3D94_12820 [Alphaproteobacteria bacterium RIFCSPHIGHO2_12_FULL_66_14]
MTAKPPDAAKFISALLAAVHELTGRRPPPTWTHVDKVQRRLATGNTDAVDAAIRIAVARGWLRSDGDPASSVTLTVEGLKVLVPLHRPR